MGLSLVSTGRVRAGHGLGTEPGYGRAALELHGPCRPEWLCNLGCRERRIVGFGCMVKLRGME